MLIIAKLNLICKKLAKNLPRNTDSFYSGAEDSSKVCSRGAGSHMEGAVGKQSGRTTKVASVGVRYVAHSCVLASNIERRDGRWETDEIFPSVQAASLHKNNANPQESYLS